MNEVLKERRLVVSWVAWWKSVIGVAFDVPVGVYIAGVVGLDAGSFNLLKSPLRQVDIAGTKITAEISVL